MKIHMVKKGDTLYQIAQSYNVELDKLIALNPQIADPNVIEVGMKVKIPSTPKPVQPPNDYLYKHTVMQGDTLWKLGKAWNVPLNEMIEANPQLKNPSVLMTGETVFIPKVKPQPSHHSDHHHHQGGHGHGHGYGHGNMQGHVQGQWHHHKKNTAPIATQPVVPVPIPMPIEQKPQANMPQANMPNAELSPAVEIPYPMPYNEMPNVEMPMMPNMNQQPMMPNMNQQPTMPNMNQQLSTPNQPEYISPFSENVPEMMPEVPSNIPNSYNPSNYMQAPATDLFQQYQVPATEVLSHDFGNVNQVAWNQPESMPISSMPSTEHMHYDMYNAPMHDMFNAPMHDMYNAPMHDMYNAPMHDMYNAPMQDMFNAPMHDMYNAPMHDMYNAPMSTFPAFQQPVLGGDCGCGGPQYPSFQQPTPYSLAPQMEMPMTAQKGFPNATYPSNELPNMTLPMAEQPCFPISYNPLAMTSAYPGSVYPMNAFPMGYHPYGGFPYGHEQDWDCGCGNRSQGDEDYTRIATKSSPSTKAAPSKTSAPSGSKRRTRPAQASVSRISEKRQSSRSKSQRSPWINV